MPIYEFKCGCCGAVNEVIMSINDKAPEQCEICGKGSLEKIMSTNNFVLKGSGWYETDFKDKKKPKPKDSKKEKDKSKPSEDKKTVSKNKKSSEKK